LSPATFASSVYMEARGWFLFGGTNDLETSQKLVGIDSYWETGPPVMAKNIEFQCTVKVRYSKYFCIMNQRTIWYILAGGFVVGNPDTYNFVSDNFSVPKKKSV